MNGSKGQTSPKWGSTTKLVVALAFLTVIALLLTFYHTIVGPLVLALLISYLFHPLADKLSKHLHMPWGLSVNLIYIIFVAILLFLVISGGVFLINQMQSLITFIQATIKDLPTLLNNYAVQKYTIGPFTLDMTTLDVSAVVNQILSAAQSMVGQIGSVLGSIASSTAVVLGWIFFVVMISYFVLSESKGAPEYLSSFDLPGYELDLQQIEKHLARIWSAFLRGQLIVTGINVFLYSCLLGGLGVQYFYVLAVVAGFARFIPYLGAWISWTTFGLVAYFQGNTLFGLDPIHYVLLVLITSIVLDSIMD
ncbi:MAG: AI-2E family transporter, partial [Anaerolineae bacterium]|nr:AI-2E family transporter [Anaerolineae bacterium]